MTESEAKTKWCPAIGLMAAVFSVKQTPPSTPKNCIGSACMMWRHETESKYVDLADGGWLKNVEKLIDSGYTTISFDRSDPNAVGIKNTAHGCCGLAGKP